MKKKLLSLCIAYFICFNLFSQDFSGINSGNYTGVTGVMLQPASIVDSRYKFDINLFSTDVRYSNNYFLVDRNALLKFNKNNFDDYQTFKSKYLSEASLAPGEKAFFNISNRTQLPLSFMANLSKKSAFALTFQSRSMIQGRNITPNLAKLAYNGFYYQPLNNRPIDASGLTINSLSWIEAGLTYGRVLFNNDRHFLKGAFTAKYLGGVASLNMGSENFRIGVNSDSTININASNFRYNHNKNADFDMVFDKNFRPDANAFGIDAGLVYEYRGNLKNFKYIKNDDEKSYLADRRDVNKYIFKLGVSILDAGMFTFEKPDNVNSFNANIASWDIRNGHYNSIKEFDTALAKRVVANVNDPRKYNVYLPGALSVQLDIRFVKGLYLNAMAYRPLKIGSDAGTRFDNYGYYIITPRYERRHFGIYFPYTFFDKNDITNYSENRLGATVRLGPLFIGSSNLGTMAFKKNLEAADVHIGLKAGITYGKPTKASRLFESKPEVYAITPVVPTKRMADTIKSVDAIAPTTPPVAPKSQLVLDYTKGQVYSIDSVRTGQIIIINNNNYYYGANLSPSKDNVLPQKIVQVVPADSVSYIRDSLKMVNDKYKRKADSVQRKLADSISKKKLQLDSLINRLQILRSKMDSIKTIDSSAAFKSKILPATDEIQAVATTKKLVMVDTIGEKNKLPVANKTTTVYTEETVVLASKADTVIAGSVIVDTMKSSGKPGVNPVATSAIIKKKVKPTSDSITVVAKVVQPQQVSPPQNIVTNVPEQQSQLRNPGNDDLMNRYFRESTQLQADISRLERRLDEEKNSESKIKYQYPLAAQVITPVALPAKRDIIYIHDTVRIYDTINVMKTLKMRDTVNITKTDTFVRSVTSVPKTIYVPVLKEKIVEGKIDYTKLPAETILFAIGKSAIRAVYNNKLNYLAGILQKNQSLKVSIIGHTDKSGSPEINEQLSFKRANTVKHFFMDKGIAESRLTIEAVAAADPVLTGYEKADASQNRRVVIKLME